MTRPADSENHPEITDQALARERQKGPPSLSAQTLVARLQLRNVPLIGEIKEIVLQVLGEEQDREMKLLRKSQSTLASAGVSLSLISLLFGQLLASNRSGVLTGLSKLGFSVALLGFLVAAICSLWAQRIRGDNLTINEDDVFRSEVLEHADEHADDEETKNQGGLGYYRRYIIAARWHVYQTTFRINNNRAARVRWAQNSFFLGIVGVAIFVITILCETWL